MGGGWLIFDLPAADLSVHPVAAKGEGALSGTPHISFFCDDLAASVAEYRSRGVEFTEDVQEMDWGRAIHFKAPGDFEIMLFEPRYKK